MAAPCHRYALGHRGATGPTAGERLAGPGPAWPFGLEQRRVSALEAGLSAADARRPVGGQGSTDQLGADRDLPDCRLLTAAGAVRRNSSGEERREAHVTLTSAYFVDAAHQPACARGRARRSGPEAARLHRPPRTPLRYGSWLRRTWIPAVRAAGLDDVTPHD